MRQRVKNDSAAWGACKAPPYPLAGFFFRGKKRTGRKKMGTGKEEENRKRASISTCQLIQRCLATRI